MYAESISYNVSEGKDIVNVGNDSGYSETGGFMYLTSGTNKNASVNFNVANNASLTIGKDGESDGYDSIAGDSQATITKTGAGKLVVNGSMDYFTETLNVDVGVMEANNGLGAKAINIANGATLGLQINGNNTLSNSSLVFTNNGTLILTSKVGLASGDYTVSAADIEDYGATKTYGGALSGNTFTVAQAKQIEAGSEAVAVEVAKNGIVEVKSGEATTVAMAFNTESAVVNKVLEVTDSLAEFAQSTGADFAKMGAFEFDVDMTEGDTVVLSFYVGDSTLTASDFSIFHKADGGQWEAGDVSNVSYDGAFLSFVVSHFSSYGYTAVPEPAEWAAIFGALALGFAIYRRRK